MFYPTQPLKSIIKKKLITIKKHKNKTHTKRRLVLKKILQSLPKNNNLKTSKWKNISNKFKNLIKNVNSFIEFENKLKEYTNTQVKGNYFEFFAKLYCEEVLKIYGICATYYLFDEIPKRIKKEYLNLYPEDRRQKTSKAYIYVA